MAFGKTEVSRYLDRNSPFSGIWENIVQSHSEDLPEETRQLMAEYLLPKYKKLFQDWAGAGFVYHLPTGKPFVTAQLAQVQLMEKPIHPEFEVSYAKGKYTVDCRIKLPLADLNITENELDSPFLFKYHQQVFVWQQPKDVLLVESFLPNGKKELGEDEWPAFLQEWILPLSKDYPVHFTNVKKEEWKDLKPELKILLKEKGEYLLFQPIFHYKGYDISNTDRTKLYFPLADKLLVVHRNTKVENELLARIEALHSGFVKPAEGQVLALRGKEVLRNNWFFLFMDAVKDMNTTVYGFEALKHFRFNTAKPSTKIFISSHTDWFDAKVEIHFGDQKVTVEEVKKALVNKQQFVQLDDGTLGILPEEWVKKYALLFRVGDGKADNIKLSKYHFSVIEELYLQRDEQELFFQLEEKYERLKDNHEIKPIPAPSHLQEVLRP
ncbi:MAG: helicase SNF2, partial [Sphingobacteriia bacterium]